METYKAGVLTGEQTLEIRELPLRRPGPGQALVKVHSCAICTLEQRVYLGAMKYYPFAGGHEVSGVVAEVGEGVKTLKPGDNVTARLLTSCGECYYCRSGLENQCVISFKASTHEGLNGPGGLAEYMLMDSTALYKMAGGIDLGHAALAEPLACCVHSIGRGNIGLGEDVAVIGAGIMGALHIRLAKLRGARVIACEVDAARLETARKMGADVLVDSSRVDAVAEVKALTEGRGVSVAFCTAALPQLAAQAIAMTDKLGRVVLYSSFHPKNPIELDVNQVHYSEMIITGSVNPLVRDFQISTRLLSSGLIDPTPLISERKPFAQLTEAFERAIDPHTYRVLVTM
ncbi:MAG: alcohol dehydrogenase catalytic domain-containing protein [Christensenellaceae bacterium]|jgi:L-iditol 2-dehydrogenase|nr:alcohol dehydrogenase catalytic domain-containing protein [Christensenellaceae bacterium]